MSDATPVTTASAAPARTEKPSHNRLQNGQVQLAGCMAAPDADAVGFVSVVVLMRTPHASDMPARACRRTPAPGVMAARRPAF